MDDVDKLLRKLQLLLLNNPAVSDDVDRDCVIDEAKGIKVQLLKRRLHLDDVLLAHFIGVGVHDHGDLAVETVEFQTLVDIHCFPCRDMVEHNTFLQLSYA